IDHTAGLLLLRESGEPIRVYSTAEVREALTGHYPVLPMLERYCGATWTMIGDGPVELAGSSLEVECFPAGGDAPLYMGGDGAGLEAVGLTVRDRAGGQALTYAPGLAALDHEVKASFEASDCVLVDGTFWTNDELVALGIAKRDARAMGHAPLTG